MSHVTTKHSIRINTVTEPHVFPSRLSALDWLMKSGLMKGAFENLPDSIQGTLLSGGVAEISYNNRWISVKIVEMNNHGGEA